MALLMGAVHMFTLSGRGSLANCEIVFPPGSPDVMLGFAAVWADRRFPTGRCFAPRWR